MRSSLVLLFAGLLTTSCIVVVAEGDGFDDGKSHRHASAPKAPWKTLFDGGSLDAWRGYKQDTAPSGWQIQGDALVRVASAGDLITRDLWRDFELEFEWKVTEGANSGVIYLCTEDKGASYETGPEYQILDNATLGEDGDMRTSAASNYALHAPPADYTNPVGEWNSGRIVVDDGHVEHWLNGQKVVEYELGSPEWRELVDASKFKAMPDYGLAEAGHVALQDHGNTVFYRKIRIRSLD